MVELSRWIEIIVRLRMARTQKWLALPTAPPPAQNNNVAQSRHTGMYGRNLMSEAQGFIIPPPVPTPVSRCFENLFLLILIFIKFSVYLIFFLQNFSPKVPET